MTEENYIPQEDEANEARSIEQTAPTPGPKKGVKSKSLLGNAIWSLADTVMGMAVALIMAPLLIGSIGESLYGLYALLFVISGSLNVMNIGLAEATIRFVAHYHARDDVEGINSVYGSSLLLYAGMAMAGWAIMFFGATPITSLLKLEDIDTALAVSVIRLTSFNFVLLFVGGVFQAIPQAVRRYDVLTWLRTGQSVFLLGGSIAVVYLGGGLYALILWTVVTSVLRLIVSVVFAKRLIPELRIRPAVSRAGLREVLGYGVYAFLNQLLALLWVQTDRLLLGALVGMKSVAYLTPPKNLGVRAYALATNTGHALFPRFSGMTSREELKRLYVASTWTLLLVTLVVFVPIIVLLPDFMRLWINAEFARKSAWVGQLLCIGYMARGAYIPCMHLFGGIGKPQYLSRVMAASAITALTANAILIPLIGLTGAGYAFCLSVVWNLVAIYAAWRYALAMKDTMRFGRIVAAPMALGFSCLFGFTRLRASLIGEVNWLWLFILGSAFALGMAALLALWETLLGREDSQLVVVITYVRRFLGRRRGAQWA